MLAADIVVDLSELEFWGLSVIAVCVVVVVWRGIRLHVSFHRDHRDRCADDEGG